MSSNCQGDSCAPCLEAGRAAMAPKGPRIFAASSPEDCAVAALLKELNPATRRVLKTTRREDSHTRGGAVGSQRGRNQTQRGFQDHSITRR